MSLPREVVPGRFLFLTRRCAQRQFLLSPSSFTNGAFLFCMLLAAKLTGVTVILACAMSNHYHAVVYDRDGRYPEFIENFHRLLARVMNARLGRRENFWAAGKTSVIHLVDREALLERLVYTAANPVVAHLVARVSNWPGVNTFAALLQRRSVTAHRPTTYFRHDGAVSEALEFTPQLPEHELIGDPSGFLAELQRRVSEKEVTIANELALMQKQVLGERRVKAQSWRTIADSPQKRTVRRAITASERAARDRTREFLRAYGAARAKWRDGNRDVVFPVGTYWLRIHARVRVGEDSSVPESAPMKRTKRVTRASDTSAMPSTRRSQRTRRT